MDVDEEPEDGAMEVFDRQVDENAHKNSVDGMNKGQRSIYDHILNTIENQATRKNVMHTKISFSQHQRKIQVEAIETNATLSLEQIKEQVAALPVVSYRKH